jgi:hypothetical protein
MFLSVHAPGTVQITGVHPLTLPRRAATPPAPGLSMKPGSQETSATTFAWCKL